MSRHSQAGLIAVLLLCTSYARSSNKTLLRPVTIDVFDDAGVVSPVLKTAEMEAERIFEAADVQIRWRDCTTSLEKPEEDPACRALRTLDHLSLRIVPGSAKENQDVFGVAFLGADGTGAYIDVFYGSVEKFRNAMHSDVGRVLGHVMAHEIGHLLIGSHAHAPWGIMCANWHHHELRLLEMGELFFTAEQHKSIYSHLLAGSPPTTSLEARR